MNKLLKENKGNIFVFIMSPILYLITKNIFATLNNVSFVTQTLTILIIMVMPLYSLILILGNLEKISNKKYIKYILIIICFLLALLIIILILNTLIFKLKIVL